MFAGDKFVGPAPSQKRVPSNGKTVIEEPPKTVVLTPDEAPAGESTGTDNYSDHAVQIVRTGTSQRSVSSPKKADTGEPKVVTGDSKVENKPEDKKVPIPAITKEREYVQRQNGVIEETVKNSARKAEVARRRAKIKKLRNRFFVGVLAALGMTGGAFHLATSGDDSSESAAPSASSATASAAASSKASSEKDEQVKEAKNTAIALEDVDENGFALSHLKMGTNHTGFEKLLRKYGHMPSFITTFKNASGSNTVIEKIDGESVEATHVRMLNNYLESCLSESEKSSVGKKFKKKTFKSLIRMLEIAQRKAAKDGISLSAVLKERKYELLRDAYNATAETNPTISPENIDHYVYKYDENGPLFEKLKRKYPRAHALVGTLGEALRVLKSENLTKPEAGLDRLFEIAMDIAAKSSDSGGTLRLLPAVKEIIKDQRNHPIQLLLSQVEVVYKKKVSEPNAPGDPGKSGFINYGQAPESKYAHFIPNTANFHNGYALDNNYNSGVSTEVLPSAQTDRSASYFSKTEYDWLKGGYDDSAENARLQRQYQREVDSGWATHNEPEAPKKPSLFARAAKRVSGWVDRIKPKQIGVAELENMPAERERRELQAQIPKKSFLRSIFS